MSWIRSVVLGIVQGLTEFLPISSTAHLRVIPALLGWEDPGAAFTAVIQAGTLAAVLIYFSSDIRRLAADWFGGLRSGSPLGTTNAKLAWMIIVGTIPIVVCGVIFEEYIEDHWRSLYVISGAAIGLAILLIFAEAFLRRRVRSGRGLKTLSDIRWADAVAVGAAQALALVPGALRSGVTITAGLFAGMNRETAARFSFLLSLPSVFAACVYKLIKQGNELLRTETDVLNLALATIVSGMVGYLSIAFLLAYLKTRTTYVFIVYRLLLGGLLLFLLWRGVLTPDENAPARGVASRTSARAAGWNVGSLQSAVRLVIDAGCHSQTEEAKIGVVIERREVADVGGVADAEPAVRDETGSYKHIATATVAAEFTADFEFAVGDDLVAVGRGFYRGVDIAVEDFNHRLAAVTPKQ